MTTAAPILIIGAGISGLTLAQACRNAKLPYQLFEKNSSEAHRSAGWGLTLSWSLPDFKSILPQDILDRLPETFVNKAAVDAGEKGNFTFFNLKTGEAKFHVPATERIRVSRERLRGLMLTGLNVEWDKSLVKLRKDSDGITASFADGSSASGCIAVGCDGAHSQVRRLCHPLDYQGDSLPIRFLGAGVLYPESKVKAIMDLDPYFLQGSDPDNNVFLWFSFLTTPSDNPLEPQKAQPTSGDSKSELMYQCQIMTSWPYREGWLGRVDPTNVPNTHIGQRSLMKHLSSEWAEPFRTIAGEISPDSDLKEIVLEDWRPRRTTAFDGRVALIGDAAHTMVMFRGAGANHAIVDAARLLEKIGALVQTETGVHESDLKTAIDKYQDEMIERTAVEVAASRQACMDAHDYEHLDDRSPLVRKRLMKADLEDVQAK